MWERQAKALASVEKTKADKDKWQSKFYSILEDDLCQVAELCMVQVEKI